MRQFKREIELTIGNKKFTYPDFTIYFRVNFDEDEDANDSRIEIYNISGDSISRIKKDSQVILNAGYKGDTGTIFTGLVDKVNTDRQMADKIATIEATDNEQWRGIRINKTYKGRKRGSQIIADVLSQTNFDIGDFNLPNDKFYWNKTFDTTALDVIQRIAKDCGAKVHNNKGKIFIRDKNKGDRLGFVVSSDTGLVERPEKLEDDEDTGYNIPMLLNHRITTDTSLTVKSKTANGNYRVRKGRHIADRTRFYTEVEAVE